MKNRKQLLSKDLTHYLRALPDGPAPTTSDYVAKGSELVSAEEMITLRALLPDIRKKLYQSTAPATFVQRMELLAVYYEEMLGAPAALFTSRQQTAFALLYFLKGYDRIPDSVPEIGYMDDAAVVNQVIENNRTTLREHWLHRNWGWPAGI
jgi:uncharacterized membrane protein YkvA (DUF1232 family)